MKALKSFWIGIPLAAILLDQALRAWCDAHLVMVRRYSILGQKSLSLTRFYNTGLAMDRLTSMPYDERKVAVLAISIVAFLGVALVVILRRRSGSWIEHLGLTLVLASGISNLLDTLRLHAVVDTFQVQVASAVYIPFNLADVMIWSGITLASLTWARELFAGLFGSAPDPLNV